MHLFYRTSVLLALTLAACSSPEETEQAPDAPIPLHNYVKAAYGETVLQQYLHMKDALVSSNVQGARDAGKLMYMHLSIDNPAHVPILKPLTEIIENEDLALQRSRFLTLSQAMQTALEEGTDAILNKGREPLFIQYCPMAFGHQGGTWLSAEPHVLNPYYGDEMLTCGVVRDTL
tara:strand:+ start:177 stop:701 length:525 start_codon:yes stop_codon:yes gene_type:complete